MFGKPLDNCASRGILIALLACVTGSPATSQADELVKNLDRSTRLVGSMDLHAFAADIHTRIFTVDTHVDVPVVFGTSAVDPSETSIAQVDFPKMRRGGLDLVFFSVAVGQRIRSKDGYAVALREALARIDAVQRVGELFPEEIEVVSTPTQARTAHAAGKLVAAIGMENGFPLGRKLDKLEQFRSLGVSYISLVHIGHNDIADSANPIGEFGDKADEHNGLSEFGRIVVKEMNRLGLMVDVSHASKKAMLDMIDASSAPVIASHSAVRALVDSPRNLDDEQLLALKENGGVLQISGYSPHIRPDSKQRSEAVSKVAAEAEMTSHMQWVEASNEQYIHYGRLLEEIDRWHPRATVADFADHIDYVVHLIGIDHVGIGSDFYAGGGAAVGGLLGWMDASDSPSVTLELVRRGYSEADIAKIWGGNLMRVWEAASSVACLSCSPAAADTEQHIPHRKHHHGGVSERRHSRPSSFPLSD
jgi:membrane dipeptidase